MTSRGRAVTGVVGVAVATAGLAVALGPLSGVMLVLGLALVASTAWLGPRGARVVGTLLGTLVVFGVARAAWNPVVGAVLAVVFGVLAFRSLPTMVMRRIAFLVPSLVVLIFTTTLLMYRAPGSPFAQERVATPQVEAALRAHYGVPKSATAFFGIYMKRLVVDGTLGPSIKVQGRSVEQLLAPALPVSMTLGLLALVIATVTGLALGLRAGLEPNSPADYASMGLVLVGVSLPSFVIGAALMIVFALKLGVLPVAGWGGYKHLVMPAVTLALPYSAYIARLARGGTIEVMQQDFVRTARAKGASERDVVLRHALRGAILPVVSFLGPAAAGILTGSFVVETLFDVPGVGQWFVRGAINRDYSVVLGTAILYASLVTGFNLLVDLAYAWLDPRVRGQP
ncbi:MAG TPA: ABC transporter permease [Polyangiaceae bacterium]|jgi:oligopeptide transport system permease protein|nr:ABC transporter permease [Polyangiaceae bacterium]